MLPSIDSLDCSNIFGFDGLASEDFSIGALAYKIQQSIIIDKGFIKNRLDHMLIGEFMGLLFFFCFPQSYSHIYNLIIIKLYRLLSKIKYFSPRKEVI